MEFSELLEILSDLHPEVDFETAEKLFDNKILDSFDVVTIITEVGSEFDIQIPADQIVPENFNSAKALYDLICRIEDDE
ncbi:MAG: acyl carrier protein [Clostridia bacterium]|nr:acyl carrier protein [Oscillospiraceae bacterium]MBQ6797235.1 acyl carrier protein [Clostridia bacterium]